MVEINGTIDTENRKHLPCAVVDKLLVKTCHSFPGSLPWTSFQQTRIMKSSTMSHKSSGSQAVVTGRYPVWLSVALFLTLGAGAVGEIRKQQGQERETGSSDLRRIAQQGKAFDVLCDRQVAWIKEAQVFAGTGTVWHEAWEPFCLEGQPNLELLGINGYEIGSVMGDMKELIASDGHLGLQEWLGECKRGSDLLVHVPAQVKIEPLHKLVCWEEGLGVYLGEGLPNPPGECTKCRVAVVQEKYLCSSDNLIFCDTDDYDYSAFDAKYDNSCSARERREWLVMGEDVASSLHKEECGQRDTRERKQ